MYPTSLSSHQPVALTSDQVKLHLQMASRLAPRHPILVYLRSQLELQTWLLEISAEWSEQGGRQDGLLVRMGSFE